MESGLFQEVFSIEDGEFSIAMGIYQRLPARR